MVLKPRSEASLEPIALPKTAPLLFVVSGPSGVGKDAVVEQLRKREHNRHYAITATTRPLRPGETEGVHYHFRTQEQFQDLRDSGELLEWAQVYGHYYGVPKFELRNAVAKELDVVLKVDVQGAATIKRLLPQAILIFIAPYSMGELLQRHFRRRTESGWELQQRLETAQHEMAALSSFEYVVVNKQGELVRTVASVESIILAEKSRVAPRFLSL